MCNQVATNAAPLQGAPARPEPAPMPKPTSSVAGTGGCAAPTQFDPSSTGTGPKDQLGSLLQQAQALGVQLAGQNPAQVATQAGGPGGLQTAFQRAEAHQVAVQLVPLADGASAIENLRRISSARGDRLAQLETAFVADQQSTGSINPVDAQKLALERSNVANTQALVTKLAPLASTIDTSEGTALIKLVNDANTTGRLDPSQLARVLIQIEGSALGLPASYTASANRGQDFARSVDMRLDQLSNQVASDANATGAFDPQKLQQVSTLASDRSRLADGLRRNFDLARTNPADAQARLDRALQSTDLATVIAALA